MRPVWAVALGGIAGAACRWALAGGALETVRWPWGTFVANAVGCLLLGVVVRRGVGVWRDALGAGFCGGLTTFSTFSVEVAAMLRADRPVLAVGYVGASVLTGYVLYDLGRRA